MEKHQPKILILIISLAISVVIFFSWQKGKTEVPEEVKDIIPEAQASDLEDVMSPDGKVSLEMKKNNQEGDTFYSFLLNNEENGSQKLLWDRMVSGGTMSLPFNAFSPDNKYVFLKEEVGGSINYFVLKTSGEEMYGDGSAFCFSDMFKEKYQDYVITDVTGWGGVGLIIVNTDKVDGGTGPSFWFDVTSKSFIRLSTRFN